MTTSARRSWVPRPSALSAIRGVPGVSLPTEIVAGITLAALMIPLNIGYAEVAGLPPVVGLYAAILPCIVFGLLASSRHLVASPDAAIAAMFVGLLSGLAAPGDPRYLDLVLATTILCGVVFAAFWAFRLSFLANFLSGAVLVGFITALGLEVLVSQVQKILGVSVEADRFIGEVWGTITALPQANLWSIGVGVGTIAMIVALKRVDRRLPGALIGLIVMTVVVALLHLDEKGVSVVGAIPGGLPSIHLPQVSLTELVDLIPIAFALCAATMAEAPLLARSYAEARGEPFDPDQDFLAFGGANVAAGLSGAFALGSSASRTAAMDSMRSKTQLPSVVAGVVVALVLLFFTDQLALLPNAALAGIVAYAVLGLIDIKGLEHLWRVRRTELVVAVVAIAAVLALGVLQGVIVAFLLSILDLLWRASRPASAVLVPTPDGRAYEVPAAPTTATEPGVVVFRFSAPLFFANASRFRADVAALTAGVTPPVRAFVLDASGIDDIDTTGAEALRDAIERLRAGGAAVAVARCQPEVSGLLATYGLLELLGQDRVFDTDRDAVAALTAAAPAPTEPAPTTPERPT
ncbi:MAG: SulP family inorganic anion transporter [Chloroflexota bacterium]